MNPILSNRRSLAIYLAVWVLLGALLATLATGGERRFFWSLAVAVPATFLYAFVCLAAWYPARALPLDRTRPPTIIATHLLTATIASLTWIALWRISEMALRLIRPEEPGAPPQYTTLFAAGFVLYLLAVAIGYLMRALEISRELERRRLEVEVVSREAELTALRAQIDPHFLFNCLNSISALCGTEPMTARAMTIQLAGYLRTTLRIGRLANISLPEEIELAHEYLEIERTRFGARLIPEFRVDPDLGTVRIPPLLLQPLVENAVKHGIAQSIEGGTVVLEARHRGTAVEITITNASEPGQTVPRGTGIGLANVRRRLATYYRGEAALEVIEENDTFRVVVTIPADSSGVRS